MQIKCDKCDKPFMVENAQPGQKVECPHCGDVNIIPGGITRGTPVAVSVQQARDRAAEAGYPSANGPETDVMMVRPAMLRAHPIRFLLLMIVLLGGIGGGAYMMFVMAQPNQPVAIGAFAAAAVAFIVLLIWKIHTLSEGLRITTKRTIESKGLLSKATSEVLHSDIRNIQVEQSFLDRVWNVGLLSLSSSAENEDVVEMRDVPNPAKVKGIIDLYRPM